jgi:hypothetical protein
MSKSKNPKLALMKVGEAAKTRTNGRGVTRVITGTILAIVKRDTVAPKKYSDLPHANKSSNRDRYILKTKTGFAWANAKTTIGAAEKLPAHKPRLSKPAKAKKVVKAKKPAAKKKPAKIDRMAQPAAAVAPKKADKPKQTWYGIVDGKVVAVRKVLCPAGFSATKPDVPAPAPAASPEALPQAAV